MPNLRLTLKKEVSPFRKIAIGTWSRPGDPSVYGTIELRMEQALEYLAKFREKTGQHATVTHLVGRAVGAVLREVPDANAILRRSRIYLREDVAVFFQVAMTDQGSGKVDLSGMTIHEVDRKSLRDICVEMNAQAEKVRARKDENLEKSRELFHRLPYPFIKPLLNAMSYAFYTLNLDPKLAGMPKDPFGAAMVTNVGSLGLDTAYAPLVPYSRVPILIALGAVKDQAVVENGAIKVGKVMKVNVTFDHRFIDGVHASKMSAVMREWMEHPFEHFDALD
jgi:pyruvate/2-oxoglutarate dehydrogenase complex dihydrolipoamide acyltransferase (E2) component